MSDAFSFMFAFYGLLLGLALAEIAAGFSRAYDERKLRPLGLVAPLFGALLLVDLITFWTNAWEYRDMPGVSFVVALAVASVSLLYYFAATQVFPKASEDDALDSHIMQHRRVVVFCVLVSNVMTQIPPLIIAVKTHQPFLDTVVWAGFNLTYYALLCIAALAPSKRVVVGTLSVAIVFVVGVTAAFSTGG
jgi:hypothetical protein